MFKTQQDVSTPSVAGQHIMIISKLLLGIAVFLIPSFFLTFTRDSINAPKLLLILITTLLGLLFWCIQSVIQKQITIRIAAIQTFFVLFIISTFASAIFSVIPSISLLGRASIFTISLINITSIILFGWLLIQYLTGEKIWWRMLHTLLLGLLLPAVFFFLQSFGLTVGVFSTTLLNLVSSQISVYSTVAATVATLSLGLLLNKSNSRVTTGIAFVSTIVQIALVFYIGFFPGILTLLIGSIMTIVLGMRSIEQHRSYIISFSFALFLVCLAGIFFGIPQSLRAQVPTEISLGVNPSVSVSIDTITDSAKQFILGSGVGTFQYAFSLYKPMSFNPGNPIWNVRMQHARNTPLDILTEMGVLGGVIFLLIILVLVGTIVMLSLRKTDPINSDYTVGDHTKIYSICIALVSLTIGMFFVSFDIVAWWLWIVLIAFLYTGIHIYTGEYIKEKIYNIKISPEYSIASSFSILLLLSAILLFGVYGIRIYNAEAAYTHSIQATNIEEVQSANERAVTLRPSYVPYLTALSGVYMQKAITLSNSTSTAQQALPYISNAIAVAKHSTELWKNDVSTWETVGVMYQTTIPLTNEAATLAIEAYTKATELEPNNPALYWRLGIVYSQQKNLEEAKKAFEKSITVKPDFVQAYIDLSTLFEQEENIDQSIAIFQPIFPIIQNNSDVLFMLGRLFYNRDEDGDVDRAIQLWQRAVSITPTYSNAIYGLGLAYEKKGDTKTALSFFREVKNLNPDNPDITDKINALIAPQIPIGPAPIL